MRLTVPDGKARGTDLPKWGWFPVRVEPLVPMSAEDRRLSTDLRIGGLAVGGCLYGDGVRKVEVRRSRRRQRTVSAYMDGDTMIVLIPARMSRAEERHWVAEMERKLQRSEHRRASPTRQSDTALLKRCTSLADRYLDGAVRPVSVRWVPPMRTRWASCTPAAGTIRVSSKLRDVPGWVLDYVLVHELAHLKVPGHGPRFWALCSNYPKTERAIGYLQGLSAAAGLGIDTDADDVDTDDAEEAGAVDQLN